MRRVIVLGGFGFFGGLLVQQLAGIGIRSLIGSRRGDADVVVDVQRRESIEGALRKGDLVIDAVGPFQQRTTALVQAAIATGFDVIDLSDSLSYAHDIYRLKDKINASGIRVLTACSTVSAISAACLRISGFQKPVHLAGVFVPATKLTAVKGTAASLLCSVGRPVFVWEGGNLRERRGWLLTRRFRLPQPIDDVQGHLFESADSITLPPRWPSLQSVRFFVSTNVTGLNTLFTLAARNQLLRRLLERVHPLGLRFSRLLGHQRSGVGYEIEDESGAMVRIAFTAADHGYVIPVAPAVLAVTKILDGTLSRQGLVPPDCQIEPHELIETFERLGIEFFLERE